MIALGFILVGVLFGLTGGCLLALLARIDRLERRLPPPVRKRQNARMHLEDE